VQGLQLGDRSAGVYIYDAASQVNWLPIFRDKVMVSKRRHIAEERIPPQPHCDS
jgi:hypothetical protein